MNIMEATFEILPFKGFDICVGHGFLKSIPNDVVTLLEGHPTICIISDSTVGELYGQELQASFQKLKTPSIMIPSNDATSSLDVQEKVENISGNSFIISLGGSSINKLAMKVAQNCKSCVGFSQIPTTLNGCVDFGIERVGVEGKKSQPKRVYVDLGLLQTLPRRHYLNGMSEVIKVAAIYSSGWRKWVELVVGNVDDVFRRSENENFLHFIETNASQLFAIQQDAIKEVVVRTIKMKSQIFERADDNPKILGVLRLGNSIGEAIEALAAPELLRGECISIGMVKEASIYGENVCSSATNGRLVCCLKRFQLPTHIPPNLNTQDILTNMKTFPKNASIESVELVLQKQIAIAAGVKVSGTIRVPGSKSISNRVLLIAAMGRGTCRISGILHSDDTHVMMNALEQIGAKFQWIENDTVLVVQGTGGNLEIADSAPVVFVNNSGITARFLASLLTLVKRRQDEPIILTGSSRLNERPIGPLVDALRNNGCKIEYLKTKGCLPLAIYYTGLQGGVFPLSGKVSSTFVTAILLSAPYASREMRVELDEEKPTSLPYILMTIELMKKFNVQVEQQGSSRFTIPCGAYENPSNFEIEADASSATYPLAMAAITGGTVCIRGLGEHSLQGDAKFYTLLESMGCIASQTDACTEVSGPPNGMLNSVEINLASMTDAFMTAVVVAAVSTGTTRITGIANQRVKESNRIAVMVTELGKIGISCGELDDGIWVDGIGNWSLEERRTKLKKAYIDCHNDHRIAMSFAVLGCVLEQIIITDKDCTDKTYPEFWEDCQTKLGIIMQPDSSSNDKIIQDVIKPLPPCIYVIGMRGSGKSMLGLKASQIFQLKSIDMDLVMEERFKEPLSSFVEKNGWEMFRRLESELLKELMMNNTNGTIVCTGGGIVETELCRVFLKIYPYVIYIKRDLKSIISNLNLKSNRVNLYEPIDVTNNRRLPWYEECSKYHFVTDPNDEDDVEKVNYLFARYLSKVIPNMPPLDFKKIF